MEHKSHPWAHDWDFNMNVCKNCWLTRAEAASELFCKIGPRETGLPFVKQMSDAVNEAFKEEMELRGLDAWLPERPLKPAKPGDGPMPIKECTCPMHGPDGLMAVGCRCGAI